MHDAWTSHLSEYLDDELPPAQRAALDAHLAECAACRELLVELGGVVARARSVENRPPADDLWEGIAARIGARKVVPISAAARGTPMRRLALSIPQLAAAAVTLVVLGGAGGWIAAPLLRGGVDDVEVAAPAIAAAAPARLAGAPMETEAAVTAAVEELEAALENGRGRLSPSTIRTLEANLAIIDSALAEAQRAVVSDPGNAYLQTHLADVMRRKVMLLQQAATLASAET